MYSLVLMTAMATAPSGPEFNGYFRNLFRGGNCSGASCSGGGVFHGRILSFFSFNGGCCGGSTSNSCNGGVRYSCTGSMPSYSCNGGYAAAPVYSCNGSYAAAPSYSCCGGGGGAMPYYSPEFATPSPAYFGPVISSYTFPTASYSYPLPPVPTVEYASSAIPPTRTVSPTSTSNQLPPPAGPAANRATVVVRLPADARLYAENQLLTLTSGERTFVTPELPSGREYAYNFKIEYDRNGRTVSESQRINVTAGKTATLVFDDLTLGAKPKNSNTAVVDQTHDSTKPVSAEKPAPVPVPTGVSPTAPARILVKLPENASLYIDGKLSEKRGEERQFTTPPLPLGKEFSYSMKLEKMQNGQPEQVTQKVVFRAGEAVLVDFTQTTPERRVGR